LGCGQEVHEREGGVGRETDEDSPDDLAQEERSQKKDSRKEVSREEVSREEDEETLVTT